MKKKNFPSTTALRVFGGRAGRWRRSPAVLCWVWVYLASAVRAAPVPIDAVTATFHGGSDEDLCRCINGLDINRAGWFVAPHTDQPQAAIFRVAGKDRPQISARSDGDFVLTQFRVESVAVQTTNIALGRPVKASGPVRLPADNLTDGFPGTFSHPLRPGQEDAFYFEIDLGASHRLDHIALRNRGDGNAPDRLSRVLLRLYDALPDSGAAPVWAGLDRADGSHPGAGEVDEVRAGAGTGRFEGRWLRLSSDSPVAFSPQFAEVEIYEDLVPRLASVRIDGTTLPPPPRIRLPAGSRWLSLNLKPASAVLPESLPCRWRLRG